MKFNSTASSLIAGIREHREDAWATFVQLYGPLVYHWSLRGGLDHDEASDVAQEVFSAFFANVGQFDSAAGVGGGCRAWLRGITKHKIADVYRSRNRQVAAVGGSVANDRLQKVAGPVDSVVVDNDSPDEVALHRRWLVRRAMRLVRNDSAPQVWQAFWRSTVLGHRSTEIASELDMTAGAVRQAKFRVLRRLRDLLGEDWDLA